jgi:flagellar hook-length control protein FliK
MPHSIQAFFNKIAQAIGSPVPGPNTGAQNDESGSAATSGQFEGLLNQALQQHPQPMGTGKGAHGPHLKAKADPIGALSAPASDLTTAATEDPTGEAKPGVALEAFDTATGKSASIASAPDLNAELSAAMQTLMNRMLPFSAPVPEQNLLPPLPLSDGMPQGESPLSTTDSASAIDPTASLNPALALNAALSGEAAGNPITLLLAQASPQGLSLKAALQGGSGARAVSKPGMPIRSALASIDQKHSKDTTLSLKALQDGNPSLVQSNTDPVAITDNGSIIPADNSTNPAMAIDQMLLSALQTGLPAGNLPAGPPISNLPVELPPSSLPSGPTGLSSDSLPTAGLSSGNMPMTPSQNPSLSALPLSTLPLPSQAITVEAQASSLTTGLPNQTSTPEAATFPPPGQEKRQATSTVSALPTMSAAPAEESATLLQAVVENNDLFVLPALNTPHPKATGKATVPTPETVALVDSRSADPADGLLTSTTTLHADALPGPAGPTTPEQALPAANNSPPLTTEMNANLSLALQSQGAIPGDNAGAKPDDGIRRNDSDASASSVSGKVIGSDRGTQAMADLQNKMSALHDRLDSRMETFSERLRERLGDTLSKAKTEPGNKPTLESFIQAQTSMMPGGQGAASLSSMQTAGLSATTGNPLAPNGPATSEIPTFASAAQHPVDQVLEGAVYSVKNGHKELVLRLNPENLGEVRINLISHGNNELTARLIASTPESRDLLQSQMSSLKSSLEAQGIQVDRLSVVLAGRPDTRQDFHSSHQEQNPQQQDQSHTASQQQQQGQSNGGNAFAQMAGQFQQPRSPYAQNPSQYNANNTRQTDVFPEADSRAENRNAPNHDGQVSILA